MNLNERLNIDSYFNHIRQTNQLFSNYLNILERQENNLTNLLNNRNVINQHNNTIRWRTYYPGRQYNNLYNRTSRNHLFTPNVNNLPSNRLTNNEIDSLTNVCNFSSAINPINTSCPITFEDFSPNDRVMIINHCRHIFNESSLRSWFTYNTHCPLCRHNLRDNTNVSSYLYNDISENEINDISENEINDVSNNLNSVFDNILNAYSYQNNNNLNSGQTATTLSTGTIYNNTTDQVLHDISNNFTHVSK